MEDNTHKKLKFLEQEMKNLESISTKLEPDEHDIPEIDGLDIYGKSIELNGPVGGDHVIFLDYKKRFNLELIKKTIQEEKIFTEEHKKNILEKLELNYSRAGIIIGDVQGHSITDSIVHAGFHQATLCLVLRELLKYGEITSKIMDDLNDRFFVSTSIEKPMTAIFGEISNTGMFRFVHAGQEYPYTFSYEHNKLTKIPKELVNRNASLGMFPTLGSVIKTNGNSLNMYKDKYEVSEIKLLSPKDILILYTDGFSDHNKFTRQELENMGETQALPEEETFNYVKEQLEKTLIKIKNYSAKEIYEKIKQEIINYGPREDDISFIIIKRTK